MRTLNCLLLLLLLAPDTTTAQTVYKCTDPDGTIVFSGQPCSTDPAKVETIELPVPKSAGTRDLLAEQGEYVQTNNLRRQCDARNNAISARHAAQRSRIDGEIAAVQERIRTLDYRIRGSTHETELRSRIPALEAERDTLRGIEAKELSAARAQCQLETEAEEKRQFEAQAARARAQRAADRAAERAASEKAAPDRDPANDER